MFLLGATEFVYEVGFPALLTLLVAMSETDLCVWIVSSWSRHQSSSSRVSMAARMKFSSGKKNRKNNCPHTGTLFSLSFTPWSRVLAACRGRSPRSSRSPRGRRGCLMAALSGRGLQRCVAAGRVSAEGAHMLLDLSHISSTTFAIKHQLSILHFWFPLYSLGNVQVNSLRL